MPRELRMRDSSLYQRLNLLTTASQQEVQAAYHRLIEANAHDTDDRLALHQAYAVLSDPSSRAAYDAMCREYVAPPPLRPLLRLYGLVSGLVGAMRYLRVNFVPLNWVIAICFLVVTAVVVAESFLPYLAEPTPQATSISAIVSRTDGPRYVTVTGKIYPEPLYIEELKYVDRNFYGMTDGNALLLVTHTQPVPGSVTLTGRLVQMESDLRRLVLEDAKGMPMPVETTYYLDAAPRIVESAGDFLDLAMLLGISALMILPSLRGYSAFAAVEPTLAPAPVTLLPLQVRATGRFRSVQGGSGFHMRAEAVIAASDDRETPYVIHALFPSSDNPGGVPHQIPLTRDLTVEWGYDYASLRVKPSILITGHGMRTLLTLDDAVTCAGVAALLQRDLG